MPEYLSPGVYVEEYDNSPRSIEGVGTSTAGFIGLAKKGPVIGAPQLVTSFRNFTMQFGGFLSEFEYGEYRYLANSVEQFFMNGGTRCFVSRVCPPDAKEAEIKKGILKVTAANPGTWGNRIQVSIQEYKKKKIQIIAKKGNVYTAKNVDGILEGDLILYGETYNQVESIFDNDITFVNDIKDDPVDTSVVPKKVLYQIGYNIQLRYNDEVENYTDVSFNNQARNYIISRLAISELIKIEADAAPIGSVSENILGKGIKEGTFTLEGGFDGSLSKVNAGTFIGEDGGPGKRTGIESFQENSVISMLAIPGVTTPEVTVALVSHCENMKNRFAVLDMPKELYKTSDLINHRNIIDSSYAAFYHPWIQIFDRSSNKADYIPPSGAVLGVYSRTDINRGVHKAPANETVACTGLKVNYTKAEQDLLNPEGVNLIRAFPGQGIRIWGARTASSNSNFKYVNVRRLFIYVEESIKVNTNWVVFEPNDYALWQRVSMTITSFLDGMWRNGMLSGASASEAYFVEIGPSTMTRDDIMNGRLICNIGIAPSRPAEFVIFRVTQHTAEAGGGGGEE